MTPATGRPAAPGNDPATRSPLRRRSFALLWSGGLVNDLGDWMLLIALPVYVFQLTGSALVTSTVFVVELVPGLIAGQLAGVVVDRWDRRRILVVGGVLQAACLLPLLAVTPDRLWIVYLVAAVQSCFARLCAPAKAALVPSLVERDELTAANSLSAVGDNLARLVGSPLGGLALQVLGLPGVVVVDAITYVLSSLLIAGVRVPSAAREAPTPQPTAAPDPAAGPPGHAVAGRAGGLVADWLDGLRTIGREHRLRTVVLIGALSQVSQGMFVVLFVVFVLERLGGTGGDVGLIRGVQAIGGVAGGVLVGAIGRRAGPRSLIGWGFIAFGLISLLTWNLPILTTAIGVYLGLFIAVGIPGVATMTGLMTSVQSLAPATHLGRVFAAFETAAGALAAVGVLAAGALADRFGVVAILDVQALIYVSCGVLALVALRPVRAAVAHPGPSAIPPAVPPGVPPAVPPGVPPA
jgi:MFS family permease